MSKLRGKQGFEAPPPQDLEKYLKQGRKSINQMKEGKPPLKFRPRRSISVKLIGIMIFIIISSSLFIAAPLLSNIPSNNGSPPGNTTQPIIKYEDLKSTVTDLHGMLTQMITLNHSLITPVMHDGAVNFSHVISEEDLLDFIWFLSQFEMYSEWWYLGKELIAYIWNESIFLSNTIPIQLKALRSLLAYPRNEISLGIADRTIFDTTCKALWTNITRVYSNTTHLIVRSENNLTVVTSDQTIFLDILAQTINQQGLFNITQVQGIASEMINKITSLTTSGKGLRESFSVNLSWLSPIYKYEDQGKLILSLNGLKRLMPSTSSIELLVLTLSNFVDIFDEVDRSISSEYNDSIKDGNQEFNLINQAIGVRISVLLEKLNVANFQISMIRTKFEASDSSFYSFISDREFTYLLDQLYLILSFEEYLVLDAEISGSRAAASFLGIGSVLMMLILIPIKRKIKKSLPKD
ncbi:MAG: hypothetical protein ACXACY_08860 [Candidatus Hodarchaeales archaeon]|jgi:hypothetical protein